MFHGWDNYYLMIGSAAGALIGLLFVVVTLTGGSSDPDRTMFGASLYMTPTMLHFTIVLSASAVALAPKQPLALVALALGGAVLVGLGNALWAIVGIRRLARSENTPHWTDQWMYGALPASVYLLLGGAVIALAAGASWAVEAIAAGLLAVLLCGVRNAWDLVTWIAPRRKTPS